MGETLQESKDLSFAVAFSEQPDHLHFLLLQCENASFVVLHFHCPPLPDVIGSIFHFSASQQQLLEKQRQNQIQTTIHTLCCSDDFVIARLLIWANENASFFI